MRNRTRSEIIADILLTLARSAATETKIMYNVMLSFGQLKEHLRYLIERNLIEFDPRARLYLITEKGTKLLDASEGVSNLVEIAPFDKIGASF